MSQQAKLPVWYHQPRREVEGVFARSKAGGCATQSSPSGRYVLNVTQYSTGPGTWGYSRGEVLERTSGRLIATVDRNFSAFPFSWCENHFVGHDYLLAGEDYQGQTVVELDTGVRIDHIPREAENGGAFCWAAHYPSPDGRFLFVEGCVWAAPYELILYDFAAPLELPYRELKRWPVGDVVGFAPDGSFTFHCPEEVRRSDGVPLHELTETDRDALDAASYDDVIVERTLRVVWHPDLPEEISIVQ